MIRFIVDPSLPIANTTLEYFPNDYAFGTEPMPLYRGSVALRSLQLYVGPSTGQVLFVDGYCPYQTWSPVRLVPPQARTCGLRVSGTTFLPGVAVALGEYWDAVVPTVDIENGWLCIGNDSPPSFSNAIEFSPGCRAVLRENELIALWLHPLALPSAVVSKSDRATFPLDPLIPEIAVSLKGPVRALSASSRVDRLTARPRLP